MCEFYSWFSAILIRTVHHLLFRNILIFFSFVQAYSALALSVFKISLNQFSKEKTSKVRNPTASNYHTAFSIVILKNNVFTV